MNTAQTSNAEFKAVGLPPGEFSPARAPRLPSRPVVWGPRVKRHEEVSACPSRHRKALADVQCLNVLPHGGEKKFFFKGGLSVEHVPGAVGIPGAPAGGPHLRDPGALGDGSTRPPGGRFKMPAERNRKKAQGGPRERRLPPRSAPPPRSPGSPRAAAGGGTEPEGSPEAAAGRRRPGGNTAAAPAGSGARCTLGPVVPSGLTRTRLQREAAACCSF